MTARTMGLTVLLLALVVAGTVERGLAASIPSYFGDESVGFVCVTATPPGSGPTTVLVQFNFDHVTFGGIPLNRADSLFTYLSNNLGLLSPLLGSTPQKTCSFTPSQILVMFPGATALQAAQLVSGTFQDIGFQRYLIVDTFLSVVVIYSGSVNTVRSEVFRVNGNNDLTFATGHDLAETLVP